MIYILIHVTIYLYVMLVKLTNIFFLSILIYEKQNNFLKDRESKYHYVNNV